LVNRQLKKQVDVLTKKVADLEEVVKKQSDLIDKLSRGLGLNSDNSSISPSKNGLGQKSPQPKNNREKSVNSSGGQSCHQGSTLEFSAHADKKSSISRRPVVSAVIN
jgi:hypothetical protein